MQKICKTTAIISTFPLIKQTQRQVCLRHIVRLLIGLSFVTLPKLVHYKSGIRIVLRIEPIITTTPRPLYQRLGGLGVAKQIPLHVLVYLVQVGLYEQRTRQVIDMFGQQLYAYTLLAHVRQNLEDLLVVFH